MTTEIKFYDFTEGDYNDVYSRKYLKGTEEQVEKYIKDKFSEEGKTKMEDLGTCGIGYGVMIEGEYSPGYEYYAEAQHLDVIKSESDLLEGFTKEEFNKKFFYHPLIDLTE